MFLCLFFAAVRCTTVLSVKMLATALRSSWESVNREKKQKIKKICPRPHLFTLLLQYQLLIFFSSIHLIVSFLPNDCALHAWQMQRQQQHLHCLSRFMHGMISTRYKQYQYAYEIYGWKIARMSQWYAHWSLYFVLAMWVESRLRLQNTKELNIFSGIGEAL